MNQLYYPEEGEQPDRSKLFQRASHIGASTFVDWAMERDAEARAVFKRLKIRPRIEQRGDQWRGQLTCLAWERVSAEGNASIKAML